MEYRMGKYKTVKNTETRIMDEMKKKSSLRKKTLPKMANIPTS